MSSGGLQPVEVVVGVDDDVVVGMALLDEIAYAVVVEFGGHLAIRVGDLGEMNRGAPAPVPLVVAVGGEVASAVDLSLEVARVVVFESRWTVSRRRPGGSLARLRSSYSKLRIWSLGSLRRRSSMPGCHWGRRGKRVILGGP